MGRRWVKLMMLHLHKQHTGFDKAQRQSETFESNSLAFTLPLFTVVRHWVWVCVCEEHSIRARQHYRNRAVWSQQSAVSFGADNERTSERANEQTKEGENRTKTRTNEWKFAHSHWIAEKLDWVSERERERKDWSALEREHLRKSSDNHSILLLSYDSDNNNQRSL